MSMTDRHFQEYIQNHLNQRKHLIDALNSVELKGFALTLYALKNKPDQRVFLIGNGGSAATASHFANDLTSLGINACSLADNTATLTCIANDFGYGDVFYRQLRAQLTAKDIVVAISASGNSHNIIKALEYASVVGAFTVGLTGFDGGITKQRKLCYINILIETERGQYGLVEDMHLMVNHMITSWLKEQS